jgi:hypothetical protein
LLRCFVRVIARAKRLVNEAILAASDRDAEPTAAKQHDGYLPGHLTRTFGDIAHAIPQDALALGHSDVVSAQVTPALIGGMRRLSVQLHERGIRLIADIVIPATTGAWARVLAHPGRQAVAPLHIAQVTQLQ